MKLEHYMRSAKHRAEERRGCPAELLLLGKRREELAQEVQLAAQQGAGKWEREKGNFAHDGLRVQNPQGVPCCALVLYQQRAVIEKKIEDILLLCRKGVIQRLNLVAMKPPLRPVFKIQGPLRRTAEGWGAVAAAMAVALGAAAVRPTAALSDWRVYAENDTGAGAGSPAESRAHCGGPPRAAGAGAAARTVASAAAAVRLAAAAVKLAAKAGREGPLRD
ncbi:hypothetical protein BDZ89DRAFT_1044564 [Hymenopellis radicata]|nr:hypothetical protein BDZ89DRAFT_1044564 [Hymenopellis radicata]